MENIIISKEFLDWYDYYKECKEKYSSLVNDVENKMICGKYKDIKLPFSNMNTNHLNRDIDSLEKIRILMMQGSTSQINVEIELVKEKMLESCRNVNFGILCNPLASTLYRMILDSSKTKKHIEDVSKQCKENEFYVSVCLRHFYASICEECIKEYSSYGFMELLNSLIEEDKFSEACSFCPIYEEIYIQANEKGLLSKELIRVMQQYGVDVPVTKKETKLPNIPTKAERKKSKKLGIETRKKIVGDGVKKILDMSDDELVRKYDGKSEDEVQEMLYEEPWCEDEYFDDDLLAFLSVLTCMSIDFEDAFINWLAHFIFRRLIDIHKKVVVEPPKMVKTTPPKVQSSKVRKVNQGGTSSNKSVTRSPKIRSKHVSQSSRNVNQARASVAIKQEETSNGKGGIIFLIIIGLLFGYGYISLKKEEAEWDMAQEQYRIESRRKAEQNEFKVREEKRKKKEGQSSNSSSSSSYDEGSDDAYSGDYDENRYDNDENYRDGVDDMLDELGE
ncbi:hypothetical protein [Holdemanella biformis]|uniref:Uncharacterized protein n=1 Tax=Holdemanella biformis DSM 3989 TaxID=518637 RepID=B7CBB4_9FIRM|nr:hypothetical protein [Holdemanella biformis]EEC89935.1 hypothetical protein EUBIFOR_01489 [Holdemanella biformis DSM 3989]